MSTSPVTLQPRAPEPWGEKRMRAVYHDPRMKQRYVRLWARYGYALVAATHTANAKELVRGISAV